MQTLSIPKKKRIYAIAFSPNGEHLAAACGDGHLRIWDLGTERVVRSSPAENCGFALAYLGDDQLVLSGADLRCWDLTEDRWKAITPDHTLEGTQAAISPDRRYLATVDQMGGMPDFDTGDGNGLRLFEVDGWQPLLPAEEAEETTGGLAFSPDGRWLATSHVQSVGQKARRINSAIGRFEFEVNDYDYLVHLREMPSAQIARTLSGWQQRVTNLAFSPDGRVLAGTAGIRLRIWDLEADRELAHHKRGPKHFQGLAFTADGRFLATVSNDETVRVWDARSWEEHTTYTWKVGKLLNIAFAPDGLRAAAGSDKGHIVLWDVD